MDHKQSSDETEVEGAEPFFDSNGKRDLLYSTLVEDGDSDCLGPVCEKCAELNIGYYVKREEYIRHIQKRLGSNFREFKQKCVE